MARMKTACLETVRVNSIPDIQLDQDAVPSSGSGLSLGGELIGQSQMPEHRPLLALVCLHAL
jgi:hypothetical protein